MRLLVRAIGRTNPILMVSTAGVSKSVRVFPILAMKSFDVSALSWKQGNFAVCHFQYLRKLEVLTSRESTTSDLDYTFPIGSTARFGLELERVAAPGWYMTFADIVDDLEAIYYAALWFEDQPASLPEMKVDIYRYKNGGTKPGGATFLASRGSLSFDVAQ